MLYSLVYTSNAIMEFDRHGHHTLLSQARARNKQLEITGMLLYADKRFIQVLEGEKKNVLALYKVIEKDSRHFKVTTQIENEIDSRMFPNWTMGYKSILPEIYKNIPGLTLFLDNDELVCPYDLLLCFKNDPACFDKQ